MRSEVKLLPHRCYRLCAKDLTVFLEPQSDYDGLSDANVLILTRCKGSEISYKKYIIKV
jgi:hypothetical protein